MPEREDATALLEAFDIYSPAATDDRPVKIGVIKTITVSATVAACQILFDGENVVGGKNYPCLSSYTPRVNDRVIVAPAGSRTSWIVLGAIGPNGGDVRTNGGSGFVAQSPNGTYWRLTPSDAGQTVWTQL